jgi:uncharacterized protein with von Willebrand factor type A (vWA) domain
MGTMLHSGQRSLAELGDFLAALRVNGVPVGTTEIDRLRQLFALEPRLDRQSLKNMLSALLVKTPAQRKAFEALFASWCLDQAADWPEEGASNTQDWPEEGASDTHTERSTPHTSQDVLSPEVLAQETAPEPPRHRITRRLLIVMLVGLVGAGLL